MRIIHDGVSELLLLVFMCNLIISRVFCSCIGFWCHVSCSRKCCYIFNLPSICYSDIAVLVGSTSQGLKPERADSQLGRWKCPSLQILQFGKLTCCKQ